jgi:hypothetical protein
VWYSTVRIAIADNMDVPWQFSQTVFHPGEHKIAWIGGHGTEYFLLGFLFMTTNTEK